jgi:hypothetical protein
MFAPETFGKERKWETNLELSPLPGSHKCLALIKQVRCVPETWGRTYDLLPGSARGLRKWNEISDSRASKKGAKKLVSSNCVQILE